ncbi:MAG: hypothetical protein Fur0019_09360 [Tibeticola sp.]
MSILRSTPSKRALFDREPQDANSDRAKAERKAVMTRCIVWNRTKVGGQANLEQGAQLRRDVSGNLALSLIGATV